MRLSLKSVFGTVLVLSAIEVVASSSAASGRVGGALQGLSTAARYLMSPSVPLIPDLRPKLGEALGPPVHHQQQSTDLTLPSLPPVQG